MLFACCFRNRKVRSPGQAGTVNFAVPRRRGRSAATTEISAAHNMTRARPRQPGSRVRALLRRGYFAAVALPN
jgi:hypothetical protein